MKQSIEGSDRSQATLFPERLDDYIGEDNPVCAVDAFVDALDLGAGTAFSIAGQCRIARQVLCPCS